MQFLLRGMASLNSYGNLSGFLIPLDLNNLGTTNYLFNHDMSSYVEKFQAGKFYHVYNRAVGAEKLFFKAPNYGYFLSLYQKRLGPLVDTFSYCLLPNHFHLLIKIKDEFENAESVVIEMLRRFFIAYAQAINVQEKRVIVYETAQKKTDRKRPLLNQNNNLHTSKSISSRLSRRFSKL